MLSLCDYDVSLTAASHKGLEYYIANKHH